MAEYRDPRRAAVAGAIVLSALFLCADTPQVRAPGALAPIDPQRVQDQDTMTWADYRPIPGRNWADPALKPERGFRLAVVGIDFPGQPFVMTMPKGSDPFGNPQIDPVTREDVPRFYADFWMKPGEVNHGQTINGYWMEQSRGKFGITEVESFGPYRMPKPIWAYGLNEYGQNDQTPDGSRADGRMERDCDEIWTAAVGKDIRKDFDAVLRLYASYDETGVWQEFGEMKFASKDDIPAEWGNPDPAKPRWIPTRYVEWTSWLAGAQQWGLSSMRQGENSGTITHELGHFAFRLPDLNNNPYVQPYRRVAAGTWDMMDRGCFNGPGGPHRRWVVPPTQGAFMPAGLMVRNRLENKFIDEADLLTLGRAALAAQGLAVAEVTARAVDPLPGTFTGIVVRFDGEKPGDLTPPDDPATNPLSAGTPELQLLHARGRPAHRLRFLHPGQRRPHRQEQGRPARPQRRPERVQQLHLGHRRPPRRHRPGRLRQAQRREGHADGRRLPPAQRRPLPRRARFRERLRMGGHAQPPPLLCRRPPARTRTASSSTPWPSARSTARGRRRAARPSLRRRGARSPRSRKRTRPSRSR